MSKSKNINFQRVCLLIVEGHTDKRSLNNIISKYLKGKQLRALIMGTDITSDKSINVSNIQIHLWERIKRFIEEQKLKKTDIVRIIHLTDTDGAFIDDTNVIYDKAYKDPYYKEDKILTAHVESIKGRNHRKAENIRFLLSLSNLSGIPYKIFFMSCNLEHVLHGRNNLTDEEKSDMAEQIAEYYLGKENTFFDDLRGSGLLYNTSYIDSWNEIQIGTNSLKRKTNLDKMLE